MPLDVTTPRQPFFHHWSWQRWTLIWGILLLVVTLILGVRAVAPAHADGDTLTVDFSSNQGAPQYYGSGLLHGVRSTAPDGSLISPLKPYLWRLGASDTGEPNSDAFSVYPLVSKYAKEIQFVASDLGHRLAPYNNMTYHDACEAMAKEALNRGWKVEWDLVNEPSSVDINPSSAGGLSPWNQCYDGVKEADPNAITVGPSIVIDIKTLENFLLSQKALNRLPDIVSWHFSYAPGLEKDVQTIRAFMAQNGIADRPISINEAVGPDQIHNSGHAVALFGAAERAKVHQGRSCWGKDSVQRDSPCWDPVLSGLLTSDQQRRGVWWAYEAYGEMSGQMVTATTSNISNFDGVASKDEGAGKALVLVGREYQTTASSLSLHLTHLDSASYLLKNNRIGVKVERISSTDSAGSPPSLISAANYDVSNSEVSIPLSVGVDEALKIMLANPDGASSAPVPTTVPATPTATPSPSATTSPSPPATGGSLPTPWQTQDIGAVNVPGSATTAGGTFTVSGSGSDIGGTGDQFRYVYQSLNGNGSMIARVASMDSPNGYARAGLMIRDSLSANAPYVFAGFNACCGSVVQSRATTGGDSTWNPGLAASAPYWVKLVREGDNFTSSISSDGTNWTLLNTQNVKMGTNVYIGLTVTSHNNALLEHATFDTISVASA